jgi:NAD(P)H-nitrite reductase large subunit
MIDAAAKIRHAVVIGGGLLGLEAANGLMKRGMQVTVVHVIAHWLMERQLDGQAGRHAAEVAGGAWHAASHGRRRKRWWARTEARPAE